MDETEGGQTALTTAMCPHDGTTSHNPEVPASASSIALCEGAGVTTCCGAFATISAEDGVLCCRCCYTEVGT